jgi:hypothetical protein
VLCFLFGKDIILKCNADELLLQRVRLKSDHLAPLKRTLQILASDEYLYYANAVKLKKGFLLGP